MEDLKLHDAVVFLVAAGLVVPFAKRLRVSPVLGFLLIGLAVGPFGLGRFTGAWPWLERVLITDVQGVAALAELGVVFLLFMIGLELSVERLWAMRRLVFGLGSAQIVVSGIVIGVIAWLFGNSVEGSVLLGGCLALSSTAIVMQLLMEQGRFGTAVGQGSFAVLLAQDMAVVPILFAVGAFGVHVGGSLGGALVVALGEALGVVALILGVGRLVVRPLFRFVGNAGSPELFMAVTLLLIIATAAGTHAAGMSAALGAFLAGLMLAETEFRHEIEINIDPFKGLLLGLFFMSVGMGVDLVEIAARPVWMALSIFGLISIKALVTTLLARAFGYGPPQAVEIGLLLAQGGEFAFVVVGLALSLDLLPEPTAQFMLIVCGATMFLTPLVARLGRAARELIAAFGSERTEDDVDVAPNLVGHVVIAGYGRTGRLLAALLDRQQIAHVALDLDMGRVTQLRAQGAPVYLGDASRGAMLQRVHLGNAAALAVCIDDPAAAGRVVSAAHRLAPRVPIVARARDGEHAAALLEGGASHVVPEVLESALQLGHVLLEQVGLPPQAVRDLVEAVRTGTLRAPDALAPLASADR